MLTKRIEVWAFMPNELRKLDACHSDDEFVVYIPGDEVGIVVHRNGTASDRYSDGRVGVPEFVRRLVEKENVLYRRKEPIGGWREVEVSASGWPVRLCDDN